MTGVPGSFCISCCERIIGTIEHFYGHLEIQCSGHLGLTGVEYREAVEERQKEIEAFCRTIMEEAKDG